MTFEVVYQMRTFRVVAVVVVVGFTAVTANQFTNFDYFLRKIALFGTEISISL